MMMKEACHDDEMMKGQSPERRALSRRATGVQSLVVLTVEGWLSYNVAGVVADAYLRPSDGGAAVDPEVGHQRGSPPVPNVLYLLPRDRKERAHTLHIPSPTAVKGPDPVGDRL